MLEEYTLLFCAGNRVISQIYKQTDFDTTEATLFFAVIWNVHFKKHETRFKWDHRANGYPVSGETLPKKQIWTWLEKLLPMVLEADSEGDSDKWKPHNVLHDGQAQANQEDPTAPMLSMEKWLEENGVDPTKATSEYERILLSMDSLRSELYQLDLDIKVVLECCRYLQSDKVKGSSASKTIPREGHEELQSFILTWSVFMLYPKFSTN